MSDIDIALIGVGRMGSALARGWLSSNPRTRLALIDPALAQVPEALSGDGVELNPSPQAIDCVIVAVKPQIFPGAGVDIRRWVGPETLVISIMAGIRIDTLMATLGTERIVRAMPNTPGAVGHGVSGLSASSAVSMDDVARVRALLAPLGQVIGPLNETLMPAVTGVSGSGPAYVFHLVEAMAAAGEAEGLSTDMAMELARQTIIGAAALLTASDETAEALRRAVTSPGGTTQAALEVLMAEDGMPSLMQRAISAAAARERALSES